MFRWIELTEGLDTCPLPVGVEVEVQFKSDSSTDIDLVEAYRWSWIGNGSDIATFRIVNTKRNIAILSDHWVRNVCGTQPVDDHVLVDVLFTDGRIKTDDEAESWFWDAGLCDGSIERWRLSRKTGGPSVRLKEGDVFYVGGTYQPLLTIYKDGTFVSFIGKLPIVLPEYSTFIKVGEIDTLEKLLYRITESPHFAEQVLIDLIWDIKEEEGLSWKS